MDVDKAVNDRKLDNFSSHHVSSIWIQVNTYVRKMQKVNFSESSLSFSAFVFLEF